MQTIQTNKRILLSNVLFATDFSQSSKAALPYAIALARQYGAKVFMAHAIAPEPHLSVPLDPLPAKADPARLDAERRLADLARVASVGRSHEELLERGDAWNVILDIVQKHDIDLIVAGTRGRHGVSKLVMGSNAEKIYRQANCPVLTIGPHVPPLEGDDWRLKHILFPTDGSEASLAALPYALSLAEENQAILIFLQLMPLIPPENREADEASARETLRSLMPAEAAAWCNPEFLVRFEFPAEGILRLAAERAVDLIVMGVKKSSSESGISTHLPWTFASQVVAEAKCPVLTVRG
jgi:nucleotide-binding universal stress UspA family protein